MSRVIVLGSERWQLQKAADLGLSIVLVQKPNEVDEEGFRYCDRVYVFDYQDIELISLVAKREHAARPISRVVSQSDVGQVVVGHLNDLLGLPGNSFRTVRTLHDKFALRQLLNAQGIGVVPCAIARTEQDLLDFAAEHPDFVMKPRMGHSSMGVRVLGASDDLREAWRWWQDFGAGDCLLETRLFGTEMSFETFSLDGEHVVVGTTDKVQRGVFELGHLVPAVLDDADYDAAKPLVLATLNAVGMVDGPGHTEIMLTPDGPRVVESHSRRPGDFVNYLIEHVTGTDMEKETFRLALGGVDLQGLAMPRHPARAAGIRFLTAEQGRVLSVVVPDDLRTRPGLVGMQIDLKVGDIVRDMRWSYDRYGWLMVVGADTAAVKQLSGDYLSTIVVETEPMDLSAESMNALLASELGETVDPFA